MPYDMLTKRKSLTFWRDRNLRALAQWVRAPNYLSRESVVRIYQARLGIFLNNNKTNTIMNVEKFKDYLEERGNVLKKMSSEADEKATDEAVAHFHEQILAYSKDLKKKYYKEIDKELDELHCLSTAADLLNSIDESVIDIERINRASKQAEKLAHGLSEILGISFFPSVEDWTESVKKVLDICGIEYTESGNYIIIKEN